MLNINKNNWYTVTAFARETRVLVAAYEDPDVFFAEGYAAGLHVQHYDWDVYVNGKLIYGVGKKEWVITPTC